MLNPVDSEPWRGLPAEVADLIEPELPAITEEVLETIAREVPDYARPLEGRFGHGIRTGVNEALLQFVSLIRDPDAGRGPGREVYVELGRGEQRVGRTLDALQAAYRVGARVAWRRIAEAGQRASLEPEPLTLLADSIFAYIDELSADSVEGYAEAQAAVEDLRRRRRQELASLLLRVPPAEAAELATAAQAASWRLPKLIAVAACRDGGIAAVVARLPADALVTVREGTGCVLLPDPEGPGRLDQLRRAGPEVVSHRSGEHRRQRGWKSNLPEHLEGRCLHRFCELENVRIDGAQPKHGIDDDGKQSDQHGNRDLGACVAAAKIRNPEV